MKVFQDTHWESLVVSVEFILFGLVTLFVLSDLVTLLLNIFLTFLPNWIVSSWSRRKNLSLLLFLVSL